MHGNEGPVLYMATVRSFQKGRSGFVRPKPVSALENTWNKWDTRLLFGIYMPWSKILSPYR